MFLSFDTIPPRLCMRSIVPASMWRPTPTDLYDRTSLLHSDTSLVCGGGLFVFSLRLIILLIVTDKAPPVLTGLPLPEEGLSDGLQLRQLQTDLLQVEGAAVLDLPHGKRVHVPEGDAHQLPGNKQRRWRNSCVSLGCFTLLCRHCAVDKYWILHPVVPLLCICFRLLSVLITVLELEFLPLPRKLCYVCLFICLQDYTKTTQPISLTDLDQGVDPGILFTFTLNVVS